MHEKFTENFTCFSLIKDYRHRPKYNRLLVGGGALYIHHQLLVFACPRNL